MKLSVLRRGAAFYAALALLLASSAGIIITYRGLLERAHRSRMLHSYMKLGPEDFSLLQDERCVGELHTELQREDGKFTFSGEGNLRGALEKREFEVRISMSAHFNSLNQLGAAIATLRSGDAEIVLGFQDPNPVNLSLRAEKGGQPIFKKTMQIPGPFLINQAAPDKFTISYSQLSQLETKNPQWKNLLETLRLRVQAAPVGALVCSGGMASLDLKPLLALAQRLSATAKFLMPAPPAAGERTL